MLVWARMEQGALMSTHEPTNVSGKRVRISEPSLAQKDAMLQHKIDEARAQIVALKPRVVVKKE